MTSTRSTMARSAGLAAVVALVPGVVAAASPDDGPPRLLGRAVLDVNTYASGPPSGTLLPPGVVNGVTFPTPSQPVQGFSSIVEGRRTGEWLAMPDNGFGAKGNSRDFLIRAYTLRLDFKTAEGGTGAVEVGEHISFRDPNRLIGFAIVNENTTDRLLTGGDIDPESLQVSPEGDLWVGDEFGPWILHFDDDGTLLEAPIPLPGDLRSPNNPFLGGAAPTQPNSRGLEGMGISGKHLYPILEGATVADGVASTRRIMFEYDTHRGEFTGRQWDYRVDPSTPFVSDVAPLDPHRLVVIERDGGSEFTSANRRVYVVDLRVTGPDGSLVKRQVLDLAAIPDPDGVSLPAIHQGDVRIGDPFGVACESVEAIRVISTDEVLVGCDNNFPNRGRNLNVADDNEFIVVEVPTLSER
jgi:hypothetical protein